MDQKVWTTTQNGRFKIMSMTPETLKDAMSLMKRIYFKDELVCRAFEVSKNPKSIEELTNMLEEATKDGISLVALDTANGKIVSVLISKFVMRNQVTLIEKYSKKVTEVESQANLQFWVESERLFDIFDHYDFDCGVEFMFAATDPDYRKTNLAYLLGKSSVELAKMLAKGENVTVSVDDRKLNLELIPKFGFTTLTSANSLTGKLLESMGFTALHKVNYDNYFYRGQNLDSKIGHVSKYYTIMAVTL